MIASTSFAAFSTGPAGAAPGVVPGGRAASVTPPVARGQPVGRAPGTPAGDAASGGTQGDAAPDRSLRRGSRLDILA